MSIATNINTRILWLRSELDTVLTLAPKHTVSDQCDKIHPWLLRVLEAQNTDEQFRLWCEGRMELSRFSEKLYQLQRETEHLAEEGSEESQSLTITCSNIMHFQDELQRLFMEWEGNKSPSIPAFATAPQRRGRSRAQQTANPNIPSFLNVT